MQYSSLRKNRAISLGDRISLKENLSQESENHRKRKPCPDKQPQQEEDATRLRPQVVGGCLKLSCARVQLVRLLASDAQVGPNDLVGCLAPSLQLVDGRGKLRIVDGGYVGDILRDSAQSPLGRFVLLDDALL